MLGLGLLGLLGLSGVLRLLFDVLKAKISQVEEKKSQMNSSILQKIPECPVNINLYYMVSDQSPFMFFLYKVCFEQFKKGKPIFSCLGGHHLCGKCKAQKTIKVRE